MAELPTAHSVRILDISLSGVLLLSKQTAGQGAVGRLRMDLSGQPFSSVVEVRRVALAQGDEGFRIGAAFVRLSSEHRDMIQRFTRL